MSKTVYMLGGFDILSGRVSAIDRLWIAEAYEGPILIVDLTCRNRALQSMYNTAMRVYFARLTKKKVVFVSMLRSSKSIAAAFASAGAICIPGGDTEFLLDELTRRELCPLFHSYTGPIAGNSAGAVAVCKDAVLTTDAIVKKPTVRPGIGLVDFSIDPHYDKGHDSELTTMSQGRVIYGVPETSAVVCASGNIEFIGLVQEFRDGHTLTINGKSK